MLLQTERPAGVAQAIHDAFDTVGPVHAPDATQHAWLFDLANVVDLGVYEVTLGGQTLYAMIDRHGDSNHSSSIEGVKLFVRVPGVPFRVAVSGRRRLGALGEDVDLGDPAFASILHVTATSAGLARELLDPPTRALLCAVHARTPQAATSTYLSSVREKLSWFVPVRQRDHGLLFPGEPMTAADLREGASIVLALAGRLRAAYERHRAEAFAGGGQPAVDAFVASHEAELAQAKQRFNANIIRVIIAVAVGMALIGLLVVAATIGFSVWAIGEKQRRAHPTTHALFF
jgi:hypothetical protein